MGDTQEVVSIFDRIIQVLNLGYKFADLGYAGIILLISIISAVVGFIFAVVQYLLASFPVYKISKKLGRKYAFLAWIPVLPQYFRMFVIADMAVDKPVSVFNGKITLKNRFTSFWIYLCIAICGNTIVDIISLFLNFIPGLGMLLSLATSVLSLAPTFVIALFEYAYFRDMLNIFKADKKSNNTTAIVVTVLDVFLFGWAKVIYLYTMLKLEPIPQSDAEPIEGTATESATV